MKQYGLPIQLQKPMMCGHLGFQGFEHMTTKTLLFDPHMDT